MEPPWEYGPPSRIWSVFPILRRGAPMPGESAEIRRRCARFGGEAERIARFSRSRYARFGGVPLRRAAVTRAPSAWSRFPKPPRRQNARFVGAAAPGAENPRITQAWAIRREFDS